jgi:hypothetical protein
VFGAMTFSFLEKYYEFYYTEPLPAVASSRQRLPRRTGEGIPIERHRALHGDVKQVVGSSA